MKRTTKKRCYFSFCTVGAEGGGGEGREDAVGFDKSVQNASNVALFRLLCKKCASLIPSCTFATSGCPGSALMICCIR